MKKAFSISGLFAEAWVLFKKNWKFSLLVVLMITIIQVFLGLGSYGVDPMTGARYGSVLISVIGFVASVVIAIGSVTIFIGLARGEEKELEDLVMSVSIKKMVTYLFASIIYGMIVILGLLLFVIPGIIAILVFLPYVYVLTDKNLNATESLKKTREMTKGNRINIFLLLIVLAIFNLLGFLAFVVGLLFTSTITMFVFALMYIKLDAALEQSVIAPEVQ